MKRIVSVWLPSWPIARLKRASPKSVPAFDPFAIVESAVQGLTISAVNESAQRAGVFIGQSLADAQAGYPGLVTHPAEPRKDQADLVRLARWAGRYGPNRNCWGSDGLWIDITGAAQHYGGEDWLLDDLTERFATFGIPAQAAAAGTYGAAHALARYGCPRNAAWVLAPTGLTRQALASLSVEGLRLDRESALLLKRLGVRYIGQLYDIPRNSIARRFRSTIIARDVLQRLDLALGFVAEPLRPMQALPVLSVQKSFSEPLVWAESVEAFTAELVDEMCELLRAQSLGVRSVRLSYYRADGTVGYLRVVSSTSSRDPHHLGNLIVEKLDAVDAGVGIDLLRLEALSVARRAASRSGFAEPGTRYEEGPPCVADGLGDWFGEAFGTACLRLSEPASEHPSVMFGPRRPMEVIKDIPGGPPAAFPVRRDTWYLPAGSA